MHVLKWAGGESGQQSEGEADAAAEVVGEGKTDGCGEFPRIEMDFFSDGGYGVGRSEAEHPACLVAPGKVEIEGEGDGGVECENGREGIVGQWELIIRTGAGEGFINAN